MPSTLAIDGGVPVRTRMLPYGRQAVDDDDVAAVVDVLRSDWLQDLPPSFFVCHNFCLSRVREGVVGARREPPRTFLGTNALPYEAEESINIHDANDIERAERWLRREGVTT